MWFLVAPVPILRQTVSFLPLSSGTGENSERSILKNSFTNFIGCVELPLLY